MDAISAFAICILIIPIAWAMGWLIVEHHDRVSWTLSRGVRRGFEVLNVQPRRVLPPRGGYSFVEVMFAVVVLGIGFIMIAAMFPVGISQNQLTQQETNAAAVARGAFTVMHAVAVTNRDPNPPFAILPDDRQNMPCTEPPPPPPFFDFPFAAPLMPFDKPDSAVPAAQIMHGRFGAVAGDLINSADRRYAFVPFYQREYGKPFATVHVVVVQVRARSTYDSSDITTPQPNLMPRPVGISITDNVGGSGTDWITFAGTGMPSVGEGAYVLVSKSAANGTVDENAFNGRIYRVGVKATAIGSVTPPADTWELSPENSFKPLAGGDGIEGTADDWQMPPNTPAWVVGREYDTDTPSATDSRGLVQDIAVYTSIIPVK